MPEVRCRVSEEDGRGTAAAARRARRHRSAGSHERRISSGQEVARCEESWKLRMTGVRRGLYAEMRIERRPRAAPTGRPGPPCIVRFAGPLRSRRAGCKRKPQPAFTNLASECRRVTRPSPTGSTHRAPTSPRSLCRAPPRRPVARPDGSSGGLTSDRRARSDPEIALGCTQDLSGGEQE